MFLLDYALKGCELRTEKTEMVAFFVSGTDEVRFTWCARTGRSCDAGCVYACISIRYSSKCRPDLGWPSNPLLINFFGRCPRNKPKIRQFPSSGLIFSLCSAFRRGKKKFLTENKLLRNPNGETEENDFVFLQWLNQLYAETRKDFYR